MFVNMTEEQANHVLDLVDTEEAANPARLGIAGIFVRPPVDVADMSSWEQELVHKWEAELEMTQSIRAAIAEAREAQQTMAMTLPCKHWAGSDFCEIKPDVCGGHNSNCGMFVREQLPGKEQGNE